MSLSIGIVGLPNVGKSTLFNALTKKSVDASNYPFCTIDPSVGIVKVPDERLDLLDNFSKSIKKIPAVIEFVDIAGLVKGASVGEGLGNQFLANIREVDAIVEVVRVFEDENIVHVHGKISPLDDISVINLELILSDFQTVSKRLNNLEKEIKKGEKKALQEKEVLKKIETVLDKGQLANSISLTDGELQIIKSLNLLTLKPILYCFNKKSGDFKKSHELEDFLKKFKHVFVDIGTEETLKNLEDKEKEEFKTELNYQEEGLDDLIKKSYQLLDLIVFFTTGPDETRAWTIRRNSTAPEAGSAIHNDFKDRFIKAEVINWEKLLESGSMVKAREKGLIRTEGKEYIVQDGDVIEFKI